MVLSADNKMVEAFVLDTLDPTLDERVHIGRPWHHLSHPNSGLEKRGDKIVDEDIIKVVDISECDFVERETALIKVHTRPEDRAEALRIADIFRANVVDSSPTSYTIEVTGDVRKVQAIINLLQPLGIKELVRTGRIAMGREPIRPAQVHSRPLAKAN